MDELIGMTFGPYDIIEKIGEGGMAVVYKGYQASLNRHVAIKMLRGELARDQEFISRFRHEALAAANLDHPNILHVYDAGMAHGRYYMAMAYVDGGSLKDMVRQGPLDVSRTVSIVALLADALDYAHRHGLVHRDVKPSNVLMTRDGRPLLTDFGIAKALYEAAQLTRTGATLGTPEYMAPEQAQGLRPDGRTDIYALGIVLYEMLTGKVPFSSDTPVATMYQQVHLPPPPLQRERANIPAWLEEIVNKALAKDPDQRYQRAGELAEALRQQRDSMMPAARGAAPAAAAAAAFAGPTAAGPMVTPAPGPTVLSAAAAPTPTPAVAGQRLTPAAAVPAVKKPRSKALVPVMIGAILLLVVAVGVGAALLLSGDKGAGGNATATDLVVYQIVTPEPPTANVATDAPTDLPTDPPTDAPTRVPTAVPTYAPTVRPTDTPVPVATSTPLPPTSTPTRAPTLAPTRTPTRALSPTKVPVKPTSTPVKAATQFSAPKLVAPADGGTFVVGDTIVLSWQSVGQLPADGYYQIVVSYSPKSDPGQTWKDETPWIKETRWALSSHDYLPTLSADGKYRWSVQVMRKTGQNAQGKPTGTALSPMSATRTLTWGGAGPGGGPSGPPTRTPLPP